MLILALLFLATLFLAYSNGANDNFKGVATLFGTGTTDYKSAIAWATATTFAGSICSIFLAEALVRNFSGKGLVPDALTISPVFLLAVAVAAALTVMLATVAGFPVSTTHGLTGALVGAGLAAVGPQVNFAKLGNSFFVPLLLSPVLAVFLATVVYVLARSLRVKCGVTKEWCVCIGETEQIIPIPQPASMLSVAQIVLPGISIGTTEQCVQRYKGSMLGVSTQRLVDSFHFISAGSVGFARGLNDTPKIVALVLVIKAVGIRWGMVVVALGMAVGGLVNAHKVAITMSKRITPLNHGQGFIANLVTAVLLVFASRWGLPVSTTHVSVGSLFGIGLITRQANPRVVSGILMSWILTLPIAAILGGLVYKLLSG
ncbi:MAG TPA: anion permease [Pyrinomonadaceae bacterium]|jgi:PiT family inorganic phosphate transporter